MICFHSIMQSLSNFKALFCCCCCFCFSRQDFSVAFKALIQQKWQKVFLPLNSKQRSMDKKIDFIGCAKTISVIEEISLIKELRGAKFAHGHNRLTECSFMVPSASGNEVSSSLQCATLPHTQCSTATAYLHRRTLWKTKKQGLTFLIFFIPWWQFKFIKCLF